MWNLLRIRLAEIRASQNGPLGATVWNCYLYSGRGRTLAVDQRFLRACKAEVVIKRAVRAAADPRVLAFPVKKTARAPRSKTAASAHIIVLSGKRAS